MIKDYIKFAFSTFRVRGLRTFLTMLGIFVGIAAIVSLISLGQGLQKVVTDQFEQLGTNKMIISPAGTFFGAGGEAAVDLTEKDIEVVKKVKGIGQAGGMIFKMANQLSEVNLPFFYVINVSGCNFRDLKIIV